jgi:hypothetical protein
LCLVYCQVEIFLKFFLFTIIIYINLFLDSQSSKEKFFSNKEDYADKKEIKVVYEFVYLPEGLFNRIQVKLFEYGERSKIWKKYLILEKNNHKAIIRKPESSKIEVKVQGIKPENFIFSKLF